MRLSKLNPTTSTIKPNIAAITVLRDAALPLISVAKSVTLIAALAVVGIIADKIVDTTTIIIKKYRLNIIITYLIPNICLPIRPPTNAKSISDTIANVIN